MTRPNTVSMQAGKPAAFTHRGDPAYVLLGGGTAQTLPYGEVLRVGSVECSIDETSGVTCADTASGHGFTVSNTAYDVH